MAHAEHSVTIAKPADQVFAFVADGNNNPRWRPSVVDIRRAGGEDGLGASWTQGDEGARRWSDRGGPPRHQVGAAGGARLRGHGGTRASSGSLHLPPAGPQRTTVTFALDMQPRGLVRLMGPMIARHVKKEVLVLDDLKEVLES